jgi:hypothetical protein
VDWTVLALDRDHYIVYMVMNLQVLLEAGNFLISVGRIFSIPGLNAFK